jgi:hypothetical protein
MPFLLPHKQERRSCLRNETRSAGVIGGSTPDFDIAVG